VVLRVGLHLHEVGDDDDFAAREFGITRESLDELVGKRGVFTDHDMVARGDGGGAEPLLVGQPVKRVGGDCDEVRVAEDANDDGDDASEPAVGGDRRDVAVADGGGADEPPPHDVAHALDARVDAVFRHPEHPGRAKGADEEEDGDEAEFSKHGEG
jgi:hypothetical protein